MWFPHVILPHTACNNWWQLDVCNCKSFSDVCDVVGVVRVTGVEWLLLKIGVVWGWVMQGGIAWTGRGCGEEQSHSHHATACTLHTTPQLGMWTLPK